MPGLRGRGLLLGCRLLAPCGAVAQLGERRVRNAEVGSSILLGSTNLPLLSFQKNFRKSAFEIGVA